jgi:hypothetical protein
MAIGRRELLLSYRRATSYRRHYSWTTDKEGTIVANPPVIEFILARRAETFDRAVVSGLAAQALGAAPQSPRFVHFGERDPYRIEVVYEIEKIVVAAASASIDEQAATIDLLVACKRANPQEIQAMLQFLESKARKRFVTRIRIDQSSSVVMAEINVDHWLDRELTQTEP